MKNINIKGWTKINAEGSNLPIDHSIKYKMGVFFKNGKFKELEHLHTAKEVKFHFENLGVAHYQAINRQ